GRGQRLLFVGRLSDEKDPALVIDVLRHLPTAFHLTVVGDGPLGGDLRASSADLLAAGRLHFAGPLDWSVARYRGFDLTLLGSRYEGCPLVALESAAAGVPFVGPPIAALQELVATDAPFLLAHTRSAQALAERVRHTCALAPAQVAPALDAIVQRHAWAGFAARWAEVLRAC
ncbi:MAG: glycosyltransferase, partial [Rhodoferax sp.]